MIKHLQQKIYKIVEFNIYVVLFLSFLTKGEGILNTILFLNFILFLISLKCYDIKLNFLKNSISLFFYLFLLSMIISSIFSINPLYSFSELLKDPLKAFLFFPVFLWIINDEKKIKNIAFIFFLLLIVYVLNGYYSLLFKKIYHADTWLLHTTLNRYGGLLALLISFGILYFLIEKKVYLKIFFLFIVIITIFSIILNATRTAYLSLLVVLMGWFVFYFAKNNFIKRFLIFCLFLTLIGILGWHSSDFVKTKIIRTKDDFHTFNHRSMGWLSALEASLKSPIIGWGVGKKIYHEDIPFTNTSFKVSPKKSIVGLETPHNTFLAIAFHQGLLGLISFLGMFFFTIKYLKFRLNLKKDFLSLLNFTILISFISYFGIFAFFNPTKFLYFSFFISMGAAFYNIRQKINENSNS